MAKGLTGWSVGPARVEARLFLIGQSERRQKLRTRRRFNGENGAAIPQKKGSALVRFAWLSACRVWGEEVPSRPTAS